MDWSSEKEVVESIAQSKSLAELYLVAKDLDEEMQKKIPVAEALVANIIRFHSDPTTICWLLKAINNWPLRHRILAEFFRQCYVGTPAGAALLKSLINTEEPSAVEVFDALAKECTPFFTKVNEYGFNDLLSLAYLVQTPSFLAGLPLKEIIDRAKVLAWDAQYAARLARRMPDWPTTHETIKKFISWQGVVDLTAAAVLASAISTKEPGGEDVWDDLIEAVQDADLWDIKKPAAFADLCILAGLVIGEDEKLLAEREAAIIDAAFTGFLEWDNAKKLAGSFRTKTGNNRTWLRFLEQSKQTGKELEKRTALEIWLRIGGEGDRFLAYEVKMQIVRDLRAQGYGATIESLEAEIAKRIMSQNKFAAFVNGDKVCLVSPA